MYKFENDETTFDGKIFPKVVVSLSDEASLTDMLEAYESFLRASGYVFNGRVTIEEEIADTEDSGGIE